MNYPSGAEVGMLQENKNNYTAADVLSRSIVIGSYWFCKTNKSLSAMRKDYIYNKLRHVCVDNRTLGV